MRRDVFVSYSQPDSDCAFELVSWIERHGIGAWIAPRDVAPMSDWAAEIIDAISAARIMILVFSASSNDSPQVRREVERAVHKQLRILPFRIDDVLPSKSLEYFLSSQHWLDAFPPPLEPHYMRLCTFLASALALPVAPVSAAASDTAAMPSSASSASPRDSRVAARHAFSPQAAQLDQIDRRLAHYIGPVAKHLVRRAAAAAADHDDLMRMLAAEIDSEPDRRAFISSCRQFRSQGT
jgi:TIR domain